MSAELDLIPKLPVLAVQTGIFLVNVGLIKNLFVVPYLKVRDDRERTTIGNKDDAIKMAAELKELQEDVDRRLSEGLKKIRQMRDERRKKALDQRQRMIDQAVDESKLWAQEAEKKLALVVQEEKAKIPKFVKEMSDTAFNTTISVN